VIPGQMTAMLRGKYGLNTILGPSGEKNREDHRHHAVDACVVAVTDQGLLQRFSKASASAREQQLNRLVSEMPLPWSSFRESVQRAIHSIKVSHRPDHNYQGAMHNDTAYGLLSDGKVSVTKLDENGRRVKEVSTLAVIPFTSTNDPKRHGLMPNGELRPYKGYKGDSNFCIEIFVSEIGRWESVVITTYEAYQIAKARGESSLYSPKQASNGRPLVMRLMRDDIVSLDSESGRSLYRVCKMRSNGTIYFAAPHESNVDARDRRGELSYLTKGASGLQKLGARQVFITPIGELCSSEGGRSYGSNR